MDYTQYLPVLTAAVGMFTPLVRQFKAIPDSAVAAFHLTLMGGIYALVHPFSHDVRLEIIKGILMLVGSAGAAVGGAATSNALPFTPVANSK